MGENTLFALRDTSPPADIPIETMTTNQCLDFLIHAEKNRSLWDALKARTLARFADIRQSDTGLEEGAPEEVATRSSSSAGQPVLVTFQHISAVGQKDIFNVLSLVFQRGRGDCPTYRFGTTSEDSILHGVAAA